jgi:hypothetical protein
MSAFPPDWEIDSIDYYETYHIAGSADAQISAMLLFSITSDCRATGAFRILLFGKGKPRLRVPLDRLLAPLPVAFMSLRIILESHLDNIH